MALTDLLPFLTAQNPKKVEHDQGALGHELRQGRVDAFDCYKHTNALGPNHEKVAGVQELLRMVKAGQDPATNSATQAIMERCFLKPVTK
jgi:hypothetical protein